MSNLTDAAIQVKLAHGSPHVAQLIQDGTDGLIFELARPEGFGGLATGAGGLPTPVLDAAFVGARGGWWPGWSVLFRKLGREFRVVIEKGGGQDNPQAVNL